MSLVDSESKVKQLGGVASLGRLFHLNLRHEATGMPENKVEHRQHLVHTLHILDTGVQLGINEQYARQNISVTLNIQLAILVRHFQVGRVELHLQPLCLFVGLRLVSDVQRPREEAQVAARTSHVFLDFLHQILVSEEHVPVLPEHRIDGLNLGAGEEFLIFRLLELVQLLLALAADRHQAHMLVILVGDIIVMLVDLFEICVIQIDVILMLPINFLHVRKILIELLPPRLKVINVSFHVFRPLLALVTVN